MINRSVLVGRLTKDVDLRQTQSGTNVASFTLAVSRPFKDAQGNREADFIQCIAWRKTAEILNQYAHKGSLIGVDGRIQTRSYQNKDNQRVYVTEVVADSITFLDSRPKGQNGAQNASQPPQDPFQGSGDITVTDDDLPF
ncbi:single-stranded DNA-binding protein [Lactobacillus kalixensis]|uniref:Single-stranded DNA-binding protein n=1 Tax=Lactobacillus kalixensis DSM 16043 TaxID=1423763 RepID=A0A0R1U612_9LACO|nr:single-stranded DNA-binding protein [Lactobacillus kalixensis]KRL88673.1 single-strand dna binding protein [Lactobacillus kalixensis DSM 16043]